MATYKKFKLKPGQAPPVGTTGKALDADYILYYGDEIPPEIESEDLTVDELQLYKIQCLGDDALAYQQTSRKYPAHVLINQLANYILSGDATVKTFLQWYQSVNDYTATITTQIMAAKTIEAIDAITWEYSQFDATDPEITK